MVASKDEDLSVIQGSPTAAAEQSKLAMKVLNGGIKLRPVISLNIVQLHVIVALPICKHTAKLNYVILIGSTDAAVTDRVFA